MSEEPKNVGSILGEMGKALGSVAKGVVDLVKIGANSAQEAMSKKGEAKQDPAAKPTATAAPTETPKATQTPVKKAAPKKAAVAPKKPVAKKTDVPPTDAQ